MSKLTLMVGLPGSGKSTQAELIQTASGNTVRINKDLLRTMLHFDKFTGVNEGRTREAARELAKHYLSQHTNVIIDDTNLNDGTLKSWKDLAKEVGAKIEIEDMTHVPVEVCVFRDNERAKHVGGTVIKNMALRSGLKKFEKASVVLCDIDGTISDPTHRLHFVHPKDGEKKDWKGFFAEMAKDPVRENVRSMLIQHYNEGKTIIFMSARPDNYKDVTLKWLEDNQLSFAWTLIMRSANDSRLDTETKRQMFEQHFPDKEVVHAIFDDRPAVIRLWKEMNLNVIDVGQGIEF